MSIAFLFSTQGLLQYSKLSDLRDLRGEIIIGRKLLELSR